MHFTRIVSLAIALVMGAGAAAWRMGVAAQAPATMTLEIEDHVAMAITGKLVGAETPNESALSRVNAVRVPGKNVN